MIWLILTITFLYGIYKYVVSSFHFWKNRGVPQKESSEILNIFLRNIFRKLSFAEMIKEVYDQFPNKR